MRASGIRGTLAGFLLALLATGGQSAQSVEPQPGGSVQIEPALSLAVSAVDGSLLRASRDLFRRTDRGVHWSSISLPAGLHPDRIQQVATTASAPNSFYAAGPGAGIVRSEDYGRTWRLISADLPSQEVAAFAVHSFRPDTIYASIPLRGVFRTEDSGGQWQKMDDGPPAPVLALAHSPLEGSMNTGWLYAATPQGPYLSMDCFWGWRQVGSLPARIGARAVVIDPMHPKRVYAVGESGVVYRSNDAGQTWAAANQGLPAGKIAALALDPLHPERLYAATPSDGLYISEDGAQSWRALRHMGGDGPR